MNRKLALVGSVSAAVVLVSGAVMVGTLLISFPGKRVTPDLASAPAGADSTTAGPQDPVVVYQDDYEYVANSDPASAPPAAPPAAASATVGGAGDVGGGLPVASPVTTGGGSVTAPPVAPVTTPPTTVAPVTTTTRPPGVPRDWPADKPIPPMPLNCREPQLEDNGVWNCQD